MAQCPAIVWGGAGWPGYGGDKGCEGRGREKGGSGWGVGATVGTPRPSPTPTWLELPARAGLGWAGRGKAGGRQGGGHEGGSGAEAGPHKGAGGATRAALSWVGFVKSWPVSRKPSSLPDASEGPNPSPQPPESEPCVLRVQRCPTAPS